MPKMLHTPTVAINFEHQHLHQTQGCAELPVGAFQALSAAQDDRERVCIIGAGKSGLIACKVLHQRGVPLDCFETGSQVCPEVHGARK